jgi:hypothetical protein
MMPLMTGALQTLRKVQVARASTTINIIQQVGASIGTAVMSVILTVALRDKLPGGGAGTGGASPESGLGTTGQTLPLEVRNLMTEAFTHTFWWATALIVPALIAAFLLPRRKPKPVEGDEEGDADTAPVLMHA